MDKLDNKIVFQCRSEFLSPGVMRAMLDPLQLAHTAMCHIAKMYMGPQGEHIPTFPQSDSRPRDPIDAMRCHVIHACRPQAPTSLVVEEVIAAKLILTHVAIKQKSHVPHPPTPTCKQ